MGKLGSTDSVVTILADTIKRVEGYNPNFAANNNEGNLIFVGQKGAVRGAGGFAKFATPADGRAALEWQVQNYINRGYDIDTFINTYAPANTKNDAGGVQTNAMSQNYKAALSAALGIPVIGVPIKALQSGAYTPSDNPSDTEGDTVTITENVLDPVNQPIDAAAGGTSFTDSLMNADPMMLAIVGIGAIAGIYIFTS